MFDSQGGKINVKMSADDVLGGPQFMESADCDDHGVPIL